MSTIANRKFGVEIEFTTYTRSGECAQQAAYAALVAAGISVQIERYNHVTQSHWKLTTDGSCGYELVSPPLVGEAGIEEVRTAAKALVAAGVTVNRQCGLHVHVDGAGLTVDEIKSVFERYADFEHRIDAFMPYSRRENNNFYCGSMAPYRDALSRPMQNVQELANIISSRYVKLNIQSYLRYGTIEFRQHSGTTNASKISNWIRFCVGFVEASRNVVCETSNVSSRNEVALSKGAKKVLEALNSTRGILYLDYIASACGLSEQSVRIYISHLRSAGHNIQTFRRRRNSAYDTTSYQLIQSPAATAAFAPAAEDDLFRGISDSVVSFYEERATEFAA